MIIDKLMTKDLRPKKNKWLLFIVLFAASLLRLWNLGGNPPHLTPDEAALGYNAYSILETGKDEHGVFMPIVFESFGDWKPGLYIYATVPFVAVLGLTEFAVRLPSALAGVIAVWLLYKIVEIFRLTSSAQDDKKMINNNWSLEILSSSLLAINPWHIQFSRGAWEVNLALTLTLLGVYFFLNVIEALRSTPAFTKVMAGKQNDNKFIYKFLILSLFFFALTLLIYQGAKLSTTLVFIAVLITYWKDLKNNYRRLTRPVLVGAMLGLFITSPIIASLIGGRTGRLEVFSVFSYPRSIEHVQSILDEGREIKESASYFLFHSESLNFARSLLIRWFNHFSGRFLFFEGDWQNLRHTSPNQGALLMSDLILLSVGILYLLKTKDSRFKIFILVWLVLSPLPAVLSRDSVHAVRALNMVIPLTIISSHGVVYLFSIIKRLSFKMLQVASFISVLLLFLGSLFYFLDSYFIHQPIHDANEWFYGYREAVDEIAPIQNNYDHIYFVQSYAQPYIYFLFYEKYPPEKYQRQSQIAYESVIDVGLVKKLDNIEFIGFSWPAPARKGDLVIGSPIDIPDFFANDGFKMIKEIRQPNGNPAFRIVEKII